MKSSRKSFGPSAAQSRGMLKHRGREGVPPFQLATLVYPFAFTSSSVSVNIWSWQWRINSLFDPDFTGTGSQPTTFDQWMALYDRYRVLAAEVDITITGVTGQIMAVAGAPGVDAAPTLTYPGVAGDRDAVIGKPVPVGTTVAKRLRQQILIKDVFGIDQEALMSELNFSGTSSSSAPNVAYYNVALFADNNITAVGVEGEIRFAVRFEAPRDNNISLTRANRVITPAATIVGAANADLKFDDKTEAEIREYLARIRVGEQATPPRLAATAPTLDVVRRK